MTSWPSSGSAAGRNPYDRDLTQLIGELSTRSEEFRACWARHDVKYHRTGRKLLHHPVVGELDLTFEALELPGDPGLRSMSIRVEPGTPSKDSLKVLASWAATLGGDSFFHIVEEDGTSQDLLRPGEDLHPSHSAPEELIEVATVPLTQRYAPVPTSPTTE